MDKKNVRYNNIDLVKIISMFLIMLSHIIPYNYINRSSEYIDITIASADSLNIMLQLIRYLGQVGNIIFLICSIWFLCEKKKINWKKIINIILNCSTVSIVCLLVLLALGYNIPTKIIVKQFFPIIFANNWFIAPYILLILIFPFLNMIIEKITYKTHRNISIFFALFTTSEFIFENKYIYNYFITFISLYFIVSFLKKYKIVQISNVKRNVIILFLSSFTLFVFVIILNLLGLNISMLSNKMQYFTNIKNPIVFLVSMSIFNIFRSIKIKSTIVQKISSTTLLLYIIHDNYLIREYVRSDWFKYIYNTVGYNNIIFICFITTTSVFIITLLISLIYNDTIQKLINYCVNIIEKKWREVKEKNSDTKNYI